MKKDKKKLFKKCERLWSQIVKLKAGNKSEYSGQDGTLNSHHVLGKGSYALRFDPRNGISLNYIEHLFGIHNNDPYIAEAYKKKIEAKIYEREGENIFDILEAQKRASSNIFMIEIALKAKLKELKQDRRL